MATDLTALAAEIDRDTDVNSSASSLISRLATAFEEAKGDPAAVQALVDKLRANNDALAASVATSTPADPEAEARKR